MLSLIFLKLLLVVGKKIKTVTFRLLVHFTMVCIFMCNVFFAVRFYYDGWLPIRRADCPALLWLPVDILLQQSE